MERYISETPIKASPLIESIKTSEITQQNIKPSKPIIPLVQGLISGLGDGYIKKLKDLFNITTVNNLIESDPDRIAQIPRVKPARARQWIEKGKQILQQ